MSWLVIARLSLFWFYVMSPVNEAVFSPKVSLHDSSRPPHVSLLIFAAGDGPVPGFQPFDSKQSGVVERPFKTSASGAHTAEAMGSIAPAYRVAAASTALPPAPNPSLAVRLAENEPAPAAATPGQAPSLVQRLEGREGDLTVWVAIAVAFFLAGWVGGSIYARRRERSRRGKLRF
jgi:hypothetical protein